jgi:hypothetical protein
VSHERRGPSAALRMTGYGVGWRLAGAVRACANAHLSDDEAVAKMGHPGFMQSPIAEARDGRPAFCKLTSENPGIGHPICAGLLGGFPEAYYVAFDVAEPCEGSGGDGDGGDYGFAAGGFDLLE